MLSLWLQVTLPHFNDETSAQLVACMSCDNKYQLQISTINNHTPLPAHTHKKKKSTRLTYGVKTINQQRMERDPAMFDSITFVGISVGDPPTASTPLV